MSYGSELAISTNKRGYAMLKSAETKFEGKLLFELETPLSHANDNRDAVVLYWPDLAWEGFAMNAVMETLETMDDADIPYHAIRLGETIDDVEEFYHTSSADDTWPEYMITLSLGARRWDDETGFEYVNLHPDRPQFSF